MYASQYSDKEAFMTLHKMFVKELAADKSVVVGRVPKDRRANANDIKRMKNEIEGKTQVSNIVAQDSARKILYK